MLTLGMPHATPEVDEESIDAMPAGHSVILHTASRINIIPYTVITRSPGIMVPAFLQLKVNYQEKK